MNRAILALVLSVLAGCAAAPAAPANVAKVPESGLDVAAFDTADHRFYMGWAQSWMAKERDESLRQQVLTNVHSPEMYRANGPLRNIPEFYTAFGVKEGDKLFLPTDKRVTIW